VGGGKSANSRFFLSRSALSLFSLFLLRALFLLRVRERESAKKALAPTSVYSVGCMAKWENFNFQDFQFTDNFLRPHLSIFDPFMAPSRPLHGHSQPPICHGQKKIYTATLLENGRRHCHLATLSLFHVFGS
jgi:hypothetical protein